MSAQVESAPGRAAAAALGSCEPADSSPALMASKKPQTRAPSPSQSVSSKSTDGNKSVGSTKRLTPKGATSVPALTPAPPAEVTWRVWAKRAGLFIWLCTALYAFLACLGLMGSAFKVLTGRTAGNLFSVISNPVAAATVGVLATTALQSSSTTTSITVALVASDAMPISTAIYVVMGANIGTSVTNTIVAVGQAHHRRNFVRALSGATVHDMFNVLTVVILLPLEAATGFIAATTEALVAPLSDGSAGTFQSPLKTLVDPVVKAILEPDKKKLTKLAQGEVVEGSIVKSGMFHDAGWSDDAAGAVSLTVSLVVLMLALAMMVKGLGYAVGNGTAQQEQGPGTSDAAAAAQRAQGNAAVRWLRRAATSNGYVAILVGALVTIVVQSSSVTTSTLTPLVGTGVITLEQMLPLTLGANIGTTTTALLAALATPKVGGVQIALAHLMFNLVGILMWYPVPQLRKVPLDLARWMGKLVAVWRPAALVYLFVVFFAAPALLLTASELMGQGAAATVLAVFLLLVVAAFFVAVAYWWRKWGIAAYERGAAQLVPSPQALELVVVGAGAATDNDASSTADEGGAPGCNADDNSSECKASPEDQDQLDADVSAAATAATCVMEGGKCVGQAGAYSGLVATCVQPALPPAAAVVPQQQPVARVDTADADAGEGGGDDATDATSRGSDGPAHPGRGTDQEAVDASLITPAAPRGDDDEPEAAATEAEHDVARAVAVEAGVAASYDDAATAPATTPAAVADVTVVVPSAAE